MALKTYGTMAVDWEQRIDLDRLRRERLARIKSLLAKSEIGALLCFDMNNVRYITSTHIGTWAQDKISRFTLLPQSGGADSAWGSPSCGISARPPSIISSTARGWGSVREPAFRCCAARCRRKWAAPKMWLGRSRSSWRCAACTKSRSEST